MSLLMDALRKAEADKKQAGAAEVTKSVPTPPARPATHDAPPPADGSDPSINVAFGEAAESPRPAPTELSLEPLAPPDVTQSATDESALPRDRDNRTSTMPSMRGVEAQLGAYFDDSQAGPATPARGAAPAATFDGGIPGTVATAQTVFEAGSGGLPRRVVVWAAVIAVTIGVLLSGAGLYYFQQAPSAHVLPSPTVAEDVERPLPKELPVIALDDASRPVDDPVVRIEPAPAPPPAAELIAPEPAPPSAPAVADVPPAPAAVAAPRAPSPPAPVPPAFDLRPAALTIARATGAPAVDGVITAAYDAYVAGDYATATRLYESALDRDPGKRDALLGLAALKLLAGDEAAAHALYRKVLRRDPGNATAQAALFSIEGGAGNDMTESRLKLLLDEGVDPGYVYFSLGNLYARNSRWADAQQAYFEALRHHPRNPDYNYNLAVSLDRIGQRDAALGYYNAAIGLADSGYAGFDPAAAMTRIQALKHEPTR